MSYLSPFCTHTLINKLLTMKKMWWIALMLFAFLRSLGQSGDSLLYHPQAPARQDIEAALKKARAQHKHVLLQAGGNWCSWCISFDRFTHLNKSIDSLIDRNYVVYHLNYSKENTNADLFAQYGYPQRFGFPVFIVLDAAGNRIHTQNSEYLELGKSYHAQKVYEFLLQWSPQALDAAQYK